ncbi:MauE/DoxX family redox-associated membrane protein [Luedemannella helvata]|uniref:Methylamine utilization protein MauE n=1 Tax=Luedemannella helvata TaxID=349315 RepID=A0ABP4VYK4_9ACTN
MDYLALAARVAIGFTFLASAVSKLHSRSARAEFATATATMLAAVLPGRPAPARSTVVAGVVAVAELAVVPLVAVPDLARAGLALAGLLLVAFTVTIAAVLRRGTRTSCRCFGGSSTPLSGVHLVRNAVLLAVAAVGIVLGPGDLARVTVAGTTVAAVTAIVLGLLVTRLDDIVDLFRPAPVTPARRRDP